MNAFVFASVWGVVVGWGCTLFCLIWSFSFSLVYYHPSCFAFPRVVWLATVQRGGAPSGLGRAHDSLSTGSWLLSTMLVSVWSRSHHITSSIIRIP